VRPHDASDSCPAVTPGQIDHRLISCNQMAMSRLRTGSRSSRLPTALDLLVKSIQCRVRQSPYVQRHESSNDSAVSGGCREESSERSESPAR
jgi:hypothetical protein